MVIILRGPAEGSRPRSQSLFHLVGTAGRDGTVWTRACPGLGVWR